MAKRRLNCIYEFDDADVKGEGDETFIEVPPGVTVVREQDVPLTPAGFADPNRYVNILQFPTTRPTK